MLAELHNARSSLRKTEVRVTRVDGRCHVEDASGAKLTDLTVPNVRDAMHALTGEEPVKAQAVSPRSDLRLVVARPALAHGSLGDLRWPMPRVSKWCDTSARSGFLTAKAHEYMDEEPVLRAKARLLAGLLREAKAAVAYTGAGISRSAGIPDWATKDPDGSAIGLTDEALAEVAASALPTVAHRVLAAAHSAGLLPKWVQQNHDGLPQKAGYPQEAMNEIHGAVFDPSNPLVPMDGKVREDLHADLLQCQRQADLVLALGSSLCGMGADRLVSVVADRARRGKALGAVIVTLQQTVLDEDAALRIFAPLDHVAALLAEELQLDVKESGDRYTLSVPAEHCLGGDRFSVRYGDDGRLLVQGEARAVLDLSPGAKVIITHGPDAGIPLTVEGRNEGGHYRLRSDAANGSKLYLLGAWWVDAAVVGSTPHIPISSCP